MLDSLNMSKDDWDTLVAEFGLGASKELDKRIEFITKSESEMLVAARERNFKALNCAKSEANPRLRTSNADIGHA
eukprot:COSAG01_NODE_19412_length_1011_cov_0.750000_1_plen_75_part_00